jgi:hypothetical protein
MIFLFYIEILSYRVVIYGWNFIDFYALISRVWFYLNFDFFPLK